MKFRTILGRIGLIVAIAAFGMSSVVHAAPASADVPPSGLGSQDLGTPGTPAPSATTARTRSAAARRRRAALGFLSCAWTCRP